ncbi:hypothetical protein L0128_12565 [candidate division KSB1 bacterium]|nr:hypothetical protein [candidate division KSB1 bacterium]
MNWVKAIIGFILLILVTGCVSTGGKRPAVMIPPGVDSLVAISSDSLVDSLFVDPNLQKKARELTQQGKQRVDQSDSLWNLINAKKDTQKVVTEIEKKRASDAKYKGSQKIQVALSKFHTDAADSVTQQLIRTEIYKLLEEAQRLFEQALVDNPFDEETKAWLAKVYQMMAQRFQNTKNYERAVQVLKSLIRVNQSEPHWYYQLGINYWSLKNWSDAYENFKQAENVLMAITPLKIGEIPRDSTQLIAKMHAVPVDTAKLYEYVYFQADTKAKLYEAEAALTLLQRALNIAKTDLEKQSILNYIDWIKWDEGNIRASELRDHNIALEKNGNYDSAARGFRKLLKVLKTNRTKAEINWRISLLEFGFLNQHEKGIERLARVIRRTPKDSLGAARDTTYRRYFDNYGVMCYNMGIRNVLNKPKIAFMYFRQAVTINCPVRGKSYLELAKLSISNPAKVIEMCHHALDYSENLALKEKIEAYRLLVEGYKRQGKVDKAKEYFIKWKILDANSESIPEKSEQKNG